MATFIWSHLFETGIEEIDLQHQRIVELLNQLGQTVETTQLEFIDALLDDLTQYAVYHFGCEERIMAETGVSHRHANHHHDIHQNFVAQVTGWLEQRKRNEALSLSQLLDFLASWLVFHILGEDQSMGRQVMAIRRGIHPEVTFDQDNASEDPRIKVLLSAVQRLYSGLVARNEELLQSHHALSDLNTSLERRVAERTAELSEANQRLREEQERSLEAEKMASLGRLVAGFAHEVNTPIGIAVGSVSQLREMVSELSILLEKDEVTEEELTGRLSVLDEASDLALSNLARAADMVRSFKRTAVDQSSDAERDYSLAEVIEDVIRGLHNSLKHTPIQVEVRCPDQLILWGGAGSVAQVLTNLIENSRIHAFADGKAGGSIQIDAGSDGQTVWIDYRDSGAGMDAKTAQHIFEPFFTTKRGAGGSGLGLYIVYNLVTQGLKGTITCESVPGRGARFIIRYPHRNPQKKESSS